MNAYKEKYMKMALRLARKGSGMTNPNPLVGAVIVKGRTIVGVGYHKRAGEAHAEINALKAAKGKARGGEMYVNLEPCCHFNRTPPCTQAIIKHGIKKVIAGMIDPNPSVSGKGIKELKKAGIAVDVGICEDECKKINEFFIKYITCKQPFVILKIAESLDGKIAAHTGNSQWITNEKSRKIAHKLRQQVDAVLVGVNTVITDDPLLTVRLGKASVRQPKRIVLDSSLRIPLHTKLLSSCGLSDTIVVTTKQAAPSIIRQIENKGAQVMIVDDRGGRVDIAALLSRLGEMGIASLLVEGGATVNASFVERGLFDKVVVFIGGCIIGGESAPSSVAGNGFDTVAQSLKIDNITYKRFDNDIMIEGYIKK